ncbi:unnamed protein product [Calicophoron daubneyi]|uniref:UPF3 domain-containing protein n=1 Tax=Calicophoron daubneyi TaxID=300641 RepID=A0AAV2TF13_CALDB
MKNCPTKVIIRRLPPKLTEEEFLRIVDPLPSHTYFRFCKPDPTFGSLGLSRAYVNFSDIDALFEFKERFDNYVFVDSEGNESLALVEFAVCQSLASSKESATGRRSEKLDKKQGTLNDDPEFIAFKKALEPHESGTETPENETKKTCWEAILEEIQARESASDKSQEVTPLLAFINQREQEARRKEEESARHGKQYKQGNPVTARKASRAEKVVRIQQSTTRRGSDSKRTGTSMYSNREYSYHSKVDDDSGPVDKSEKDSKDKQVHPTTLDVEEFPAMQGSQQPPAKVSMGPWSDRPSVWTASQATSPGDGNFSDVGSKPSGKSNTSSTASKASTPNSGENRPLNVDTRLAQESKSNSRVSVIPLDKRGYERKEHTTGDSNPADCSDGNDFGQSNYSPQPRESSGRCRRAVYYPPRQPSGFSAQSRKPSRVSRGRRDSDSSLPNHGSVGPEGADMPLDYDTDRAHPKSQVGRGRDTRRGGSASRNVNSPELETHNNYYRAPYRGGHANFRGVSHPRVSDYGDDAYRPNYSSDHYAGGPSRHSGGGGSGRGSSSSRGRGSSGPSGNAYRRQPGYSSRGGRPDP